MTGDLNTPEFKGELYAAWDHAFYGFVSIYKI